MTGQGRELLNLPAGTDLERQSRSGGTLPGGRRAGTHLPRPHGLVATAERAAAIGATTFQIFTDNPTSWRRRPELPEDAEPFRRRLTELDLDSVAIHASYLINLAGPDDLLFERSVDLLRAEMCDAPAYGARYVNVHVGSHRGTGSERGIARVADGLERVLCHDSLGASGIALVLENGSGGGNSLGATLEDLAAILDAVAARGLDSRIGFCLDTAHLWGAGYDVSTADGIDSVLAEFARLVGLERLLMIHLNDSSSARGSKHDRHAHLGEGQIGLDGLRRALAHPGLDNVAFYAETPGAEEGYDAVNMARILAMAGGLDPLVASRDDDATGVSIEAYGGDRG